MVEVSLPSPTPRSFTSCILLSRLARANGISLVFSVGVIGSGKGMQNHPAMEKRKHFFDAGEGGSGSK
jgi:hypothetical protein